MFPLLLTKCPRSSKIKWKDNTKAIKLDQPSLDDFSVWLKGQADIYDDCCYPKMSNAYGVVWDTSSYCVVYEVVKRVIVDTRREILSLIASLFDPTGFLAPFLVKAKIFLQHVWQLGVGWDDTPPPEFLKEWSKWQEELDVIAQFCIPCFYRPTTQPICY